MVCYLLEDKNGKRFVFSHIPKTGGTSLRGGGKKLQGYFKKIDKDHAPKSDWNYLFSFKIVRNPYTRFVSAYADFKHKRKEITNVNQIMNIILKKSKVKNAQKNLLLHFRPQSTIKKFYQDTMYTLKYEDYNKELLSLFIKYDIEFEDTQHVRNSKSYKYNIENLLTTDELIQLTNYYKNDFENFGYTPAF